MSETSNRKSKFWKILGITLLIYGIVFFLLRGPYLSNYFKRMFVPIIENVTRERVIIEKAAVNLFPFYLQAKGLKLIDRNGNRLLRITKSRVYIDVLGLFSKEIRIRKFYLNEPRLTANEDDVKRVAEHIEKSLTGQGKKQFNVSLKGIKLVNGEIDYKNRQGTSGISVRGMFFDLVPKWRSSRAELELNDITAQLPAGLELHGEFATKIKLTDENIEIDRLHVRTPGSELKLNGNVNRTSDWALVGGGLSVNARVDVEEINNALQLIVKRNGLLTVDGSVNLIEKNGSRWPDLKFDMNTDSWFYLESLMEIIHVDKEITGKVSAQGRIAGIYPEINGKGKATLDNAALEGLPLDNVTGDISYEKKKLALHGFTAKTYGGNLQGDAYILLPHGDYRVNADASGVSSPEFLKFIHWEPPIPQGEVGGTFQLDHEHGRWIDILADIKYTNTSERKGNVLERVITISTDLAMKDKVIDLTNTVFKTSSSELYMAGEVDLNTHRLDLDLELESSDISDLTIPYYERFIAPASFTGKASGPTDNVEISGTLESHSGGIHGIPFSNGSADFIYNTKSLSVSSLRIMQEEAVYDVTGSIDFRKADELFSFIDPYYRGKALVKNADIHPFIKASYTMLPISGFTSGMIAFEGDTINYKGEGDLVVKKCDVYDQKLDEVGVRTTFTPEGMKFSSVTAKKGDAQMKAEGRLNFDKHYNLSARLDNTRISDIQLFEWAPFDLLFGADIRGAGLIDDPDFSFEMDVMESTYKKIQAGEGRVTGTLRGRDLEMKGFLKDGLIRADSEVELLEFPIWSMDMKFNKGRYDFMIEDVFEYPSGEIALSLEGDMNMAGRGLDFLLQSEVRSVKLNAFGYDLRNQDNIKWEYIDEELKIISLSLSDNNAELNASGSVRIDDSYRLSLDGVLNVEPLSSISDNIDSLRGKADFAVDISGPWNAPEFSGVVNIEDITADYADFQYIIGPVNGALFLNKDRITFDSLDTKFAGGTVFISGAGFFKDLDLDRIYVSADVMGVKIRPSEGVSATFDGKLFYGKSSKGSNITGNIDIEKAKYEKRVDWSDWLLGMKEARDGNNVYLEGFDNVALNIRIKGAENIFIQNNIARSPVNMSLNVMGSISKPGIIGRFESDEGAVYFRGNEFRILEGSSIDFIDPEGIVPMFHILADTYRNNYYIRLSLDGTTDNFTLSLFSDPPLPEEDILSLLTFGQLSKEAKGLESGIAASEATSLVTGGIQQEVQYITGFERFEIEPHTTTEGSFSPKVTLGKRMLEDRIFVIYSRAIGTAEEQVVKVEYKLDKNLFLVGSRDEVGSTGLDLKYRFEFK
jgi:translocation and assembly module TamB